MEDYQKTTNNDNPVLNVCRIKSTFLEVLKEGNK